MIWFNGSRGRAPMYVRDSVQDVQGHISVLDKNEDFIFRLVERNLCSHGTSFQCSLIQTTLFPDIYKSAQQQIFSVQDDNVIWNDFESSTSHPRSFLDMSNCFPTRWLPLWRALLFSCTPYTWFFYIRVRKTFMVHLHWIYNNLLPSSFNFRLQCTRGRGHR